MASEEERRHQAIASIKRRRALISRALAFVVVNLIMVVIWWATGGGYFWPAWVILGTGVVLLIDLVSVVTRTSGEISEDDIRREMDKQATA